MGVEFKETLPVDLITHVLAMCGQKGERWFDELLAAIADLERAWKISVGKPFAGIEYNFVAEALRESDGVPVVLKIAPPFETTEIFGEAKFLSLHDGQGCVRLLAEDRERFAILLERAVPGLALHEEFAKAYPEFIDSAVDVLKGVLRKPPSDLADVPMLDDWFNNFRRHSEGTKFPQEMRRRAVEIYGRLSRRSEHIYYLHGDFHPGNIVTATREKFLAIDPKGIVGHIGCDIAVFLLNLERWQRNSTDLEAQLNDAIKGFAAAFDLTTAEIREWVYCHMVIGAWWNFEDMPEFYDATEAFPVVWDL